MANQLERIVALETRQKAHEEEADRMMASMSSRIDGVEESVKGVHTVLAEISGSINEVKTSIATKEEVQNAVNGDRRKRKLDLKDWVIILGAAATGFAALIPQVSQIFTHAVK